jgi:hypothetical protein
MRSLAALMIASLAVPSSSFAVGHRRATNVKSAGSLLLKQSSNNGEEPDLFEYFDPLLSPHAYPNGISPEQKLEPVNEVEKFDPPGFDPFGIYEKDTAAQPPVTAVAEERPAVDTAQVFDPTISPHAYTNGVPSIIIGDEDAPALPKQKVVGVLLMDHGSKNPASNERLQNMARLYQDSVGSSNVVVRAAHMEIATPSILDGLQSLLEAGVDEIVCHPYFLSPGRHVVEDIPGIVSNAIETLKIDIPITTTAPVGSSTDVMIGAIHSLVKESSSVLR